MGQGGEWMSSTGEEGNHIYGRVFMSVWLAGTL